MNVSERLTTAVEFYQHQPLVSMVLETTDAHAITTLVSSYHQTTAVVEVR